VEEARTVSLPPISTLQNLEMEPSAAKPALSTQATMLAAIKLNSNRNTESNFSPLYKFCRTADKSIVITVSLLTAISLFTLKTGLID
jgi:hypothetical protein